MITIFPSDRPLALVPQQIAPSWTEFIVPPVSEEFFIRAIALWTDNTALKGAAPTFHLQAPGGIITQVNPGAGNITVSGDGGTAGIANCQSLGDDIYLIKISDINEDVTGRPWKLRIKNNADKELRFVWVASDVERDTLKPWIALGDGQSVGPPTMSLTHANTGDFYPVRNLGPGPLEIKDAPKSPIGGPDSHIVLEHRPAQIAPHGVDHIVVRRDPGAGPLAAPVSHLFTTNDKEPKHNKTLTITAGASRPIAQGVTVSDDTNYDNYSTGLVTGAFFASCDSGSHPPYLGLTRSTREAAQQDADEHNLTCDVAGAIVLGSSEAAGDFGNPWEGGQPAIGAEPAAFLVTNDGSHRTIQLPKPGSSANTVFIGDFALESPTNTSSCPCAVFIGSFTANGSLIANSMIQLNPGQSIGLYTRRAAGAAKIGIACSSGCDPDSLCVCRISWATGGGTV